MTGEFNAELAEQIMAEKYREATERLTELEQKGLHEIFPTLDAVASRVEAGERSTMLELLTIAAGSFRWFETLPQQTRDALADGLEKMRSNLESAQGFLPRGRGERSIPNRRTQESEELRNAFAVEYVRRVEGLSLEDAIAKVGEESGMNDWTIQAHWQRRHDEAKMNFALIDEMVARWPSPSILDPTFDLPGLFKAAEMRCMRMPRRKKRQP